MPEKRIIQVPGDGPREVWLHRTSRNGLPGNQALYGVVGTGGGTGIIQPSVWYESEEVALDAFADQIREEIELQKLDDYNDKREAEDYEKNLQ